MDEFWGALVGLWRFVVLVGQVMIGDILSFELWLRGRFEVHAVPPRSQVAILAAAAALGIVATLRLFDGVVRGAVILMLLLIAIQVAMPALSQ